MNTQIKAKDKQNSNIGFLRILVAVDQLEQTTEPIEQAIYLAEINKSELMFLHCIPEDLDTMPVSNPIMDLSDCSSLEMENMIEIRHKIRKENIEKTLLWFGSLSQQADKKGITTEFNYKLGDAGKEICLLAKDWGADLIIVGRRGRKGLTEMFLGSVSNYVLHNAHCSVLVVQS